MSKDQLPYFVYFKNRTFFQLRYRICNPNPEGEDLHQFQSFYNSFQYTITKFIYVSITMSPHVSKHLKSIFTFHDEDGYTIELQRILITTVQNILCYILFNKMEMFFNL